jgi:hypothetical protein
VIDIFQKQNFKGMKNQGRFGKFELKMSWQLKLTLIFRNLNIKVVYNMIGSFWPLHTAHACFRNKKC